MYIASLSFPAFNGPMPWFCVFSNSHDIRRNLQPRLFHKRTIYEAICSTSSRSDWLPCWAGRDDGYEFLSSFIHRGSKLNTSCSHPVITYALPLSSSIPYGSSGISLWTCNKDIGRCRGRPERDGCRTAHPVACHCGPGKRRLNAGRRKCARKRQFKTRGSRTVGRNGYSARSCKPCGQSRSVCGHRACGHARYVVKQRGLTSCGRR